MMLDDPTFNHHMNGYEHEISKGREGRTLMLEEYFNRGVTGEKVRQFRERRLLGCEVVLVM